MFLDCLVVARCLISADTVLKGLCYNYAIDFARDFVFLFLVRLLWCHPFDGNVQIHDIPGLGFWLLDVWLSHHCVCFCDCSFMIAFACLLCVPDFVFMLILDSFYHSSLVLVIGYLFQDIMDLLAFHVGSSHHLVLIWTLLQIRAYYCSFYVSCSLMSSVVITHYYKRNALAAPPKYIGVLMIMFLSFHMRHSRILHAFKPKHWLMRLTPGLSDGCWQCSCPGVAAAHRIVN